jgi:phasin
MASSPKRPAPTPTIVHERPHFVEPVAPAPVEFAGEPEVVAVEVVSPPSEVTAEVAKAITTPITTPVVPLQEVQEKARALLEKGIVEGRANFAKAKSFANEATSAIEASYGVAKDGVVEFNVKAIEAIKASADANFELFKSLAGAKSVSEFVTLQTEFSRKQFETAFAQSKELAALARKVANEAVAPIKAHVSKSLKVAV